jgi:MFS family permease
VLTLQLFLALLVITCGPWLVWRRRDNVIGYLAVGTFVATYLIPLIPTMAGNRFDHRTLVLYADVLSVGAVALLAGLWLGAHIGARSPNLAPLTFSGRLEGERAELVSRRTRHLAIVGLLALAAAFALMKYIPYFAADRTSAKYGVGAYRPAFLRAAGIYRLGLAVCGAILPVLLAVWYRRRRTADLILAGLVVAGLLLSLSRESAFVGPLVFVVAVAVERRVRPLIIGLVVVGAFSIGALLSLAVVQNGPQPTDVASRIAASTPDVRDHLGFLRGFEKHPEPTYGRTLLAGLTLGTGQWDPSTYALHTLTGFRDFSDFASGGLRLPAPLWGYASFGWAGVAMFSALSGLFAGWGLVKVRRLLGPALAGPGLALNVALAYAFYEGTFGILSEFYFLTSSVVVRAAVAAALCLAVRVAIVRAPRDRTLVASHA